MSAVVDNSPMPGSVVVDGRRQGSGTARQGPEASRFSTEQSPNNPWYNLTRGMIEYRLGKYANVNRWLARALKSRNPMQQSPALSFSAMAEYQRGRVERARQLLGRAKKAARRIETNDRMWNNLIGAQLVIDEATALIQ